MLSGKCQPFCLSLNVLTALAQDCSHSNAKTLPIWHHTIIWPNAGLILGMCAANERRRYKVAPSLIGWAQA